MLVTLELCHAEGWVQRLALVQGHGARGLDVCAHLAAEQVGDDDGAVGGHGQPHQRPDLAPQGGSECGEGGKVRHGCDGRGYAYVCKQNKREEQ